MARFTGLRCGMSALGCMLLVYFMSVTGVSSQSSSKITTVSLVPIQTVTDTAKRSQTTPAASISPTATVPSPSTATNPTTVTQAPIVQPTTPEAGRQFDSASFIGGIILGIVLTGIFIFAFKWWQSRNKSYHSL